MHSKGTHDQAQGYRPADVLENATIMNMIVEETRHPFASAVDRLATAARAASELLRRILARRSSIMARNADSQANPQQSQDTTGTNMNMNIIV
jgi:hypothetical protein